MQVQTRKHVQGKCKKKNINKYTYMANTNNTTNIQTSTQTINSLKKKKRKLKEINNNNEFNLLQPVTKVDINNINLNQISNILNTNKRVCIYLKKMYLVVALCHFYFYVVFSTYVVVFEWDIVLALEFVLTFKLLDEKEDISKIKKECSEIKRIFGVEEEENIFALIGYIFYILNLL
ncbi:hypothetical protein RFI_02528 [Reticulomyxa filosa]|uniref:Uncharacterized protein n=1 Tax=Reticulomyxa filosa TaxID=46433 RepID=X6P8N7_RETFI|nr:hypothetical protein RFI_02528 [Reticulomyxa filosa]|eukprot:ETO34566.1 hypothetical protein RFI_02528 [Reticulomyxa filosa]